MSESVFSPDIDPPSPTLAARLRELADYFAAPAAFSDAVWVRDDL